MNGLLFLLPFVLVASLGIYQDVFATTGYDYFDVTNPDGSHTWSSHEPYILDNGVYVPFINSGLQTRTDLATVILNSDGSYTWSGKFTDHIIAKYADVSNLNSWTYPNTLNNDVPDVSWNGNSFTSTKIKSGIGHLDYKYILNKGEWKTQLEATNLSGLTTKAFGFDQIIDLQSDTISFGGIERNLDDFNGTVFLKPWLDNNKGKVLDLLNGVNFDFDLGYENLYSVTVYDTGINSSRLVFDYRTSTPLLPNETLVIDPEFGYTAGDSDNQSLYSTAVCATFNTNSVGETAVGSTGANCFLKYAFWNTTIIPDTAVITNSSLIIQVTQNTNSPTIDIVALKNDPSTVTDSQNWDNIRNNATTYSSFVGTGIAYVDLDLGTTADTHATQHLSENYFAVGFRKNPELMENKNLGIHNTNSQLRLTYAVPPDAVTDLTNSTTPTATTIGLDWTPPSAGSGEQSIIGYQINITKPQTNTPLVFLNDTGNATSSANIAGLTHSSDYSARVSAWTNVTGGHPLNNATGNVFNFTTATGTIYSTLVPTNLIVYNHNQSPSTLDLEWVAPLMDSISGYRIFREAPVGGGFSTIEANTTSTNQYYNNTGLSTNTYYNYKVAAMNGTGLSGNSSTYSLTTYHLPDAVDDLTATPNGLVTIDLSWTQPNTLYGYLTGYMINYSSPQSSDPLTIITNTTGSSDVDYTISGLDAGADYSFRVSAITIHGKNVTGGLVANATAFNQFEVGAIEITDPTNESELPIQFEVVAIDADTSDVVVTYDSSYALACDFRYTLGLSNTTYSGLTENPIAGTEVYSNFTVNGINNDIIDIYCWDTLDNSTNGSERIGQSNVPLFDQITDFQNGVFGTSGKFGTLDLMTLLIVIVSMIAFNRTHPYIGVIVMVAMFSLAGWYGLVQPITVMSGLIIMVVVLAIAYGRRENEVD